MSPAHGNISVLAIFLTLFLHRSLSSSALDALKSFYAERDAHADRFAQLKEAAEERHAGGHGGPLSMEAFSEDWNESQFWVSLPGEWARGMRSLDRERWRF